MIKFWMAIKRMLLAAVVGLVIGGAIWFHEARGATNPSDTLPAKELGA